LFLYKNLSDLFSVEFKEVVTMGSGALMVDFGNSGSGANRLMRRF